MRLYYSSRQVYFNHLNAELNPIYHLLALVGAHHIFHVSSVRDKVQILTARAMKTYGSGGRGVSDIYLVLLLDSALDGPEW